MLPLFSLKATLSWLWLGVDDGSGRIKNGRNHTISGDPGVITQKVDRVKIACNGDQLQSSTLLSEIDHLEMLKYH